MASQITPWSEGPVDCESVDTSRYEQVGGRLVERSLPNLRHGREQKLIVTALGKALAPLGLEVVPEVSINRWDKSKSDWMTPDVIVSGPGGFQEAKNGNVLPPIALAVEVLSPGQTVVNMQWKVDELFAWGVEHVWLVEMRSRSIAVFDAPDKVNVCSTGDVALGDTGIKVAISSLFEPRP